MSGQEWSKSNLNEYIGMVYGQSFTGHYRLTEEGTDMVEVLKEPEALVHQDRVNSHERIKKIEEDIARLLLRVERLEDGCVLCQDDGK